MEEGNNSIQFPDISSITMDTSSGSLANRYSHKASYFSYVFKHDFKEVLYLVRDIIKSTEIINESNLGDMSDFIITKGENTWEKGNEFSFLLKSGIRFFKKVLDYEETENYAKIVWFIYKTEPATFDFYLSAYFNRDYTGKYTTFVFKLEYNRPMVDGEKINASRFQTFSLLDEYLTNKNTLKEQNEIIYIDTSLEKAWSVISNLSLLAKMVPLICDEISCNEQDICEGTEFNMSWKQQTGTEKVNFVKLKVKRIHITSNSSQIEYDIIESVPIVPKQIVIWQVEKAEGQFVRIKFSHKYSENVQNDSIKMISEMKKKILKELKIKLEVKEPII